MRYARRSIEFGLLVTLAVSGAMKLQAAQPTPIDHKGRPLYQAGVIAVKLKSDAAAVSAKALPLRFGVASLDKVSEEAGVVQVEPMIRSRSSKARPDLPDLSRIYRVTLLDGVDVRRAARLFDGDPAVAYAEPIPAHYLDETPDDPDFDRQSFLSQVMAEAAWDVHKGEEGAEVIVGIADSGVAWRHEDLVENIYQNLGEDADGDGKVIEESGGSWVFDPGDINGIDDDGNGYPDDFVGWNFLNDDELEDNDPDDPDSHGTHVAGLAAGRTNNGTGISAISWNVKILSASAANTASDGAIERGLSGVVYLAENGADIINMSWGGDGTSQYQQEVMEYASGLGSILVAAAGNERTTDLHFPSALPGVLSVGSVGSTDRLASYSNRGISVDVLAPGGSGINGLRSTVPPSSYRSESGTSMASGVAAGAFALLKSRRPSWTNDELVQQLLGTADSVDELNPTFVGLIGEGRVNAYRALTDQPLLSEPELRLEVMSVEIVDETGDGSLEAGEGAEIVVTLRNYNHLASSAAVTLTLQTESPYVDVIDDNMVVGVTADMAAELPSSFSIQIVPEAPSGVIDLSVVAEASDASVSPHSELDFRVFVVGGGLLVWEGTEGAATFSGQYLRDELVSRGFDVTYVAGDFPLGLVGFDGVFLSFGNAGLDFVEPVGPPFAARLDADWKVDAIKSYLESGGRLFLEGSDTLGYDIYEIVDRTDLLPLFGLEGGVDGDTNEINSLDGHPGALTEGMRFTQTDQTPVDWIDIFTVSTGAEAFTESDYGLVAVQHSGRFGQRTFCSAYTIAELVDGSTTRDDLLDALIEFFDFGSAGEQRMIRRGGKRVPPPPAAARKSQPVSVRR
jgi:subtilisin family serine protease